MSKVELTIERLQSHEDPCCRGGDLLLVFALSYRARIIRFRRERHEIVPVVETSSRSFEMASFDSFLAGRWMNYYKRLGGVVHPEKQGDFIAKIGNGTARFRFDTAQPNSKFFAGLTVIESTIKRKDCVALFDEYELSISSFYKRSLQRLKSSWKSWVGKRSLRK